MIGVCTPHPRVRALAEVERDRTVQNKFTNACGLPFDNSPLQRLHFSLSLTDWPVTRRAGFAARGVARWGDGSSAGACAGERLRPMLLRKSPKLTPALLAANRRNAQRSTGPRTFEGIAHARLNGLRHGRRSPLFARFRSAFFEQPNSIRSVSQRLLRREEARHPLLARYLNPRCL
jgi:hypothetical protein